jgi:hypothetical protein
LRDRLHRRRQNEILDEIKLDEARSWRYRSDIHRLEHMAAAKGDKDAAKSLLERAEFLRLQIKSIHASRAAKQREYEVSERRHRGRRRALHEEIFANLDAETLAGLGEGRPS